MTDITETSERNADEAHGRTGVGTVSQIASAAATIAGGILAAATLVGFLLHLSGDVAHSTFMAQMGISPGLFPLATDAKIIHGYYVMVRQGIDLLADVPWVAVIFMIVMSTLLIVVARAPVKENPGIRKWLARRSYWIKQPILVALGSVAFFSAVASAACFVLLLAIVPGFAAEKFGKNRADVLKSRINAGSSAATSELWKSNERLIIGHVFATSDRQIAVYDSELKVVRVIHADGIEIRTHLDRL